MNAAKEAKGFIEGHPVVKECLGKGLVNLSQLSRLIISDAGLDEKDFDAVLVAVRRYSEKARGKGNEAAIVKLLKKSKLETKNQVCSVVISGNAPFSFLVKIIAEINEKQEPVHLIQGTRSFTLVTAQEFLPKVEKVFAGHIVAKKRNLVQVVLRTSPKIESIPGVVAFLYGLFAEHGINIIETMSSWTETLVVLAERDLGKAMEILKF